MPKKLKEALLYALSAAVILAVYFASEFALERLGINFPASLVGMTLLFALMCAGVVPLWAVEKTGDFLVGNMLFFFTPFLVMLPTSYKVFEGHVWSAVLILVLSAVFTLSATALCVEKFHNAKRRANERRAR